MKPRHVLFVTVLAGSVSACKSVDHTETAATTPSVEPQQAAVAGDTFSIPAIGFSIQKPPTWFFAPSGWADANLDRIRLNDEEFQRKMKENASEPLVVITKYEETVDTLNPVFKVVQRPMGPLKQMSAEAIMRALIPQMESVLADFELVGDVDTTEVSGHEAAHFQALFTVEDAEGEVRPVLADQWLVKRRENMLIFGASAPPDGPEASSTQFETILASIVIGPEI